MTYTDIYDAVSETYWPEGAWERMLKTGEPESFNLAEEALGRHAGSSETALRIRDFGTGGDEVYSFAELNRAANRAANFFEGHLDRGERFGLMLPPRLELYAALFGGIKTQRVFLPLDTKFGPDALSYRMADAEATTLFTTADHLEKVGSGEMPALERVVLVGEGSGSADGSGAVEGTGSIEGVEVIRYDEVERESDSYEVIRMAPTETYGMVYSSGTTGQPSQLTSEHATAVGIEPFLTFVVDLLPEDTYFAAASPAWSYGLTVGTLSPGLRGTNIGAYRGRFDAEMWLDTLERWEVTNAMVAPTVFRQLRAGDVDVDAYDIDLRVLVTAGETCDGDTAAWIDEHFGTAPLDAYGLSEGGMLVCNYPFPDWEVKHGSMGKPTPGKEVRLCDGSKCPPATEENPAPTEEMVFIDEPGVVGEVCAYQSGGSGPMAGENPEGWQRMGDLAEVDEDGYWWYRGRADKVIISAGYRIGPGEVQETLIDHDAVEEAGVIGVDHETRGNVVKAYLTLAPGYEETPELRDELVEFAKSELSKHEYPRKLEIVDELPKTASEKIKLGELEKRHEREHGGV